MNVLRKTFLALFLSLFASILFADGIPPSEESVCDPLRQDGVTPALFGQCKAYCEVRDCSSYGPLEDQPPGCQQLYASFVRNATGDMDPTEPPCLEVPSCACWDEDGDGNGVPDEMQAENLPSVSPGYSFCTVYSGEGPRIDDAFFANELSYHVAYFFVGDEGCFYINSVTGGANVIATLTPEESDQCVASVYWMQENYHEQAEIECNLYPPPPSP